MSAGQQGSTDGLANLLSESSEIEPGVKQVEPSTNDSPSRNLPSHHTTALGLQQFHQSHPVKTLHNNGENLEYIICGKGDHTILLLHGAFLRGDMYFRLISKLENNYRIIAPTFPLSKVNVMECLKWISLLMEREKIKNFMALGYSFGGGIVQGMLHFHPEWLEGAILSHTSNLFREINDKKLRIISILLKFIPFYLIKKKIGKRRVYCDDSEWNEFRNAYFEERMHIIGKKQIINFLNSTILTLKEIQGLNAPKFEKPLYIIGTPNDKDAFSSFPILQKLYPNAIAMKLEKSGGHHVVFLHPDAYSTLISQCIAKIFSSSYLYNHL